MKDGDEPMTAKDRPKEELTKEQYLWDGSGEPDPQVARLERALSQFRHSGQVPVFPAAAQTEARPSRARILQMPWQTRLAAAVLFAALIVSGALLLRPKTPPVSGPGWEVVSKQGAPQVGTKRMSGADQKGELEVGQVLETDRASRARIVVAELGQIDVDPGSRLRLLQSSGSRKRIALDRGTIHAAIWAPPGEFVVDTPSAVAVDLGCAYTLQVAPDGSGTLRTTLGWVGFERNGRESFIPAGAMCSTRPKTGPGVPYFEDASQAFRAALAQFDSGVATPEARRAALHTILVEARKQDAFTLWHLLSRTEAAERAQVYDRLAALVPLPGGATPEGILQLDRRMLDLWWNAFDLGDISVWRRWKQDWMDSQKKAMLR